MLSPSFHVAVMMFLPALTCVAESSATVSCKTFTATFDTARRGALARLVTPGGIEFAAPCRTPQPELFEVAVRNVGDCSNRVAVTAADAHDFRFERTAEGVRFTYGGFGSSPVGEVVCTVRAGADDDRLRWRIAARPKAGWAVCEMSYPRLSFAKTIGASGKDDAILSGRTFRYGEERNPQANGYGLDCFQPGFLGVQMICYYDPRALLLEACEDGFGEVKRLHGRYTGQSLDLNWTWYGWSERAVELPYDVITASVEAKVGDVPLTWHDGADLYRRWAERQRFCRTPWKFRTDIPRWLRGPCAYADMGGKWRSWMDERGSLEKWAKEYWAANYPGGHVAVHFDGWEKDGVYVMTDYFPLYPDDRTFSATMDRLRQNGILPFPWPSGYRRADSYEKLPDGSFRTDERAEFNRRFLPMACKYPDGSRKVENLKVLKGGTDSYLCGGDPRTIDWFGRDICGGLAARGVPAVSCDQNIGGAFSDCWDRAHPHTPGFGRWMTEAIRKQSAVALAALRERFPDEASLCYEEPNEQINDTVTFNNTREAYEEKRGWAGIFTYLYHEYAPSYPLGGKTTYARAYMAANGIMPRIDMDRRDLSSATLDRAKDAFQKRWVALYGGAGREWMAYGRRVKPPQLTCARMVLGKRRVPVVHIGAFRSQAGELAWVLANGTEEEQAVRWVHRGQARSLTLPPRGIELVREKDPIPQVDLDRAAFAKAFPVVDLSCDRTLDHVVAKGTPETYQGHPTSVTTGDGRIVCVWNIGHGGHAGPAAESSDGGRTWTRIDRRFPAAYERFEDCPSIYRLIGPDGRARLWVWAQSKLRRDAPLARQYDRDIPATSMPSVMSEDEGRTWKEMPPLGPKFKCVMAFASVVRLADGSYRGFFHRGPNPDGTGLSPLVVLSSVTRDGGFTWDEPRVVAAKKGKDLCEPYCFRSPDGRELCCLLRENRHLGNSMMTFSRDEGRTWTEPEETPWALTGDRHTGVQLKDGRLFIAFRDTALDSPAGGFVAWVGPYERIRDRKSEGTYRIKLFHSYAGGDCGYPGVELLPDGRVMALTYVKYDDDANQHSVVAKVLEVRPPEQ